MPIYTLKEGHDTLGPIFYLRLTFEGCTRIVGTINKQADADHIAKLLNDEAQRAQAQALAFGAPVKSRRNGHTPRVAS